MIKLYRLDEGEPPFAFFPDDEGADDGDEELTEKQVGKLIHTGNFNEVKSSIFKAFSLGNNGTEEPPARDDEEDDEEENEIRKNAAAGKE